MSAAPLSQWDSLPYAELNGPGLERLCFRLLLADRKSPRYFGDNGEAQFGIDLIVSNGNDCTVYQCKNHANFDIGEFKALLAKFEQEWLVTRPELLKPVEFVVVWPVKHTERQDVETVKKDFFERTKVRVEIWHRDILDHRLRDLPDIVADLFSFHAVKRFCTRQNWDADIFRPLQPNSGDRRAIDRFLDLVRDNRVVLDPSAIERFDEILGTQAIAIVSGASGSGKTITALALANGFDDGAWRVFYVNLRQQVSEQQLVNGVRQRSISPTVFIFDDAHLNLDLVQRTLDRLADILGDKWIRIAVVMQAAGIGSEDYDGPIQYFIEECATNKAVIELVATEARYAAILARSHQDLSPLSDERLRRLVALTGRSLALLDEILPLFAAVDDLDTPDLEKIFPLVLRRYFKREKGGVSAPALKKLAALGQFDVVVPVEDLPDPYEPRWAEVVDRLTLTFGRPESRSFFHPSVAELLFRTLSWADGDSDWIEAAARVWVARLGLADAIDPVELWLFLRSRLRLVDDLPLKQRILCDKTLLATFEKGRGELRVEWLALMARLTRKVEPAPPFAAWLTDQIVRMAADPANVGTGSVGILGLALREIGIRDPKQTQLRELEAKIGPDAVLGLLRERADLSAFLNVLRYASVEFAGSLIRALDPLTVVAILQHTRDRQGSVGTLGLSLREFGCRDPKQTQLRELEAKIGPDALLGLLRERADLSAFLNVLQYTSVEFTGSLIRALDPLTVAAFLQRTRDRQVAVGAALAFPLRELGRRDPKQTQLRELEAKIGPDALLGLLRERADLSAFLNVLQHMSVEFAGSLIRALDPLTVTAFLQRTRDRQGSVGTLGLSLRELGLRDPEQTQLRELEDKIGPDALLGLLRERADLSSFLKVLEHTSVEFAGSLIRALDPLTVAAFLQHTRDWQGSLGTLGLSLHALGLRDPKQTQLRELEDKIGPDTLLGLLRECADLSSFFNILGHGSVEFAGHLIWALDRATMAQIIDRTILLGSSIGTIAFSIGYLRRQLPECADRVDSMIGPDNLWRLFVANGDLNDLSPLLPALGRSLRDAFTSLEQGSECRWRDLAARSNFYAICRFARDCFLDLPEIVRCRLTQVIKASVTGSLQRTPWDAFASSMSIIEKLVPSDLQGCLMEAGRERIAQIRPDDLRAEDIGTAASLLLTLQQYRPDLWPIAARDFWRIVPPESTWPDDYHRLIAGRFLLRLAGLPEVSKGDAERVIRAFTTRQPTSDDFQTKVGWLFLWNLFSAWYERDRPFSDRFRGLLPLEFWDKLVQCVKQQVPRRRNEDKLNLLILAGLLRFLVPETTQALRSELKGRLKGIHYLLNKTDELTMLPAFFALQGISLLVPQRDVFTPERRRMLVEKASEYPQRTAALDLVCGWLRNEI
jgi:hypothetical protein